MKVITVIFLSFRTDRSGQTVQTQIRSSLIRVYTVCNSLCIFWMHYSKETPSCSTFRVITTNVFSVRIFRKFTVCTFWWLCKSFKSETVLHCLLQLWEYKMQGFVIIIILDFPKLIGESVWIPSHVQGLEMITFIIYNVWSVFKHGLPADKRYITTKHEIWKWCIFWKFYQCRAIPENFNDLS